MWRLCYLCDGPTIDKIIDALKDKAKVKINSNMPPSRALCYKISSCVIEFQSPKLPNGHKRGTWYNHGNPTSERTDLKILNLRNNRNWIWIWIFVASHLIGRCSLEWGYRLRELPPDLEAGYPSRRARNGRGSTFSRCYLVIIGLYNSNFEHDLIMSIPVSSLEHDVGSGYCDAGGSAS